MAATDRVEFGEATATISTQVPYSHAKLVATNATLHSVIRLFISSYFFYNDVIFVVDKTLVPDLNSQRDETRRRPTDDTTLQ